MNIFLQRTGSDAFCHEGAVIELVEAAIDDHNVVVVFKLFSIDFDKAMDGILESLYESVVDRKSFLKLGFLISHSNFELILIIKSKTFSSYF